MLQSHPSVEHLRIFLKGCLRSIDSDANKRVVQHLLADCQVCHQQILALGWTGNRLDRLIHVPGTGIERALPAPPAVHDYDQAFRKTERSLSALLSVRPSPGVFVDELMADLQSAAPAEQVRMAAEESRFAYPQLVDKLIQRSHAARYEAPEEMLRLAELARIVADACTSATAGGDLLLADARARAWGHLGNSLRVRGQLREAEQALATAQRYQSEGTGSPPLLAKLLEQISSLHIFQRRFATAIELSDQAAQIYRELGEAHSLASTLVQKAIASLYAGEPESAVGLLNESIPLIDQEKDPYLLLASCHNLILSYIDLGQPEQALALYFEIQDLYREFEDSIILLRTAWQEGRLLRDLGHHQVAEEALLRARKGFVERDLAYEVAVVSLDLSAIYVQLGESEKLQQTIAATVPIFRALRVSRDMLACLLQIRKMAGREHQALELIRMLTTRLERLQKKS